MMMMMIWNPTAEINANMGGHAVAGVEFKGRRPTGDTTGKDFWYLEGKLNHG